MGAVGQFICRRYTSADVLPSKEFSTSSRIVVYRAFPACADRTTCVVNGQEARATSNTHIIKSRNVLVLSKKFGRTSKADCLVRTLGGLGSHFEEGFVDQASQAQGATAWGPRVRACVCCCLSRTNAHAAGDCLSQRFGYFIT